MESALTILAIGSKVLPLLVQGIEFVESLFSGKPGMGTEKKDMVMQFASIAFGSLSSTADQKKWEAAKPHISIIIDEMVTVMNALK